MKVFISWSGYRSKSVAIALSEWLPKIIGNVDPWMSEDIPIGVRSREEIDRQLKLAEIGIFCLTPENRRCSPWLFFEAGALSKILTKLTYVCPYLFDLEPENIEEPLAQFQMAQADKSGTRKLVDAIKKYAEEVEKQSRISIDRKFERYWMELERSLNSIPKPKDAIVGDWLWADGQIITINGLGICTSIRNEREFNRGAWRQSDFNECVFVLNWEMLKATDVLMLDPDFQRLDGFNDSGDHITAKKISPDGN